MPSTIRTKVTYLEMRTAPQVPAFPAPADAEVHLEPMVGIVFYRALYRGAGGNHLWWHRHNLGDDALWAILHNPGVEIYLLWLAGEVAGFAELARRRTPDIELAHIGLLSMTPGNTVVDHAITAAAMPSRTTPTEVMHTGATIGATTEETPTASAIDTQAHQSEREYLLKRFLLDRAVRAAWRHCPRRVWAHVSELDDPRTRELYLEAGFMPYSEKVHVIDDPRHDGSTS